MTTQPNTVGAPAVEAPASPARPARSLKRLMIHGSMWTVLGFGASQLMRVGGNLIMARLLLPDAFGLMLLVNVLRQGLHMFTDLGLTPAVIQSKRAEDPVFLNTAWTIQVIRGVAIWLCACLLAWPVARLYNEPELATLIPAMTFITVISGFNSSSFYTLNRRVSLARTTLLELCTQLLSLGVTIDVALHHATVWAFVYGALACNLFRAVYSHLILPGVRHRFCLERESRIALIHFGKWIILSSILGFIVSQSDRILLGKFMSITMLGVYSVGFAFPYMARTVSEVLAANVLMPVYRHLADEDPAGLRHKTFRARLVVLAMGLPPLWILATWGPQIIYFLWPKSFHEAGWMVQLLALSTIPVIICATISPILLAVGNSFRFTSVLACHAVALVVAMVAGHWLFGNAGLMVGIGVAEVLNYPVLAAAVRKYGVWLPWLDLGCIVVSGLALLFLRWISPEVLAGGHWIYLHGLSFLHVHGWW